MLTILLVLPKCMLEEKKTKIRMPGSKRHKNMNTAAVAMTMQTVVLSLSLKQSSFGSIHLYFYVESMGCFDSSRFSSQLFFLLLLHKREIKIVCKTKQELSH
jgi:hypothetical protein